MSTTMTTVDAILKEVYQGQINDQLNEERVVIKRLERTAENISDDVGGKRVVFPVRSGRNHGISYRGEGVAMADAGRQGYKAAQESLKSGYGRVKVTGHVMDLAESNKQAFASALDREMDGIKQDIGKDENRIAWGHPDQAALGHTGILAKLTSSPGPSVTFTVDTVQWLEVGMVIDTVNSGTSTVQSTAATITAINSTTLTVTVAVAITSTSGYYVCRTGNYSQEPYGLSNIVDSAGALHALNPATAGQEFWSSQENSTTTVLTEMAMIAMADNIRKAGGGNITAIFCSLGVRRAYWNILTGMRRYNEPKSFAGGLVGLSFMYGGKDIPVVDDPDAPASTMALVNEPEIKLFRDKDWAWQDKDGSIFKWVTAYDQWEAWMKQYWQLGTHSRNSHGKFTALTEATA
jgi:hypothetical protein